MGVDSKNIHLPLGCLQGGLTQPGEVPAIWRAHPMRSHSALCTELCFGGFNFSRGGNNEMALSARFSSSVLLSRLELSDTKVYAP